MILLPLLFLNSVALASSIIYSNDVMGDIEPCNCRNNPEGGMTRKAELLARLPKQEFLQIDAGDLLFEHSSIPPLLHEQAKLKAEYLLKSMDKVGHNICVPGEKDFALGLSVFDTLRKKTKIKFLAANATKNGVSFLPASEIINMSVQGKQIKVGIIGLLGDNIKKWPRELKIGSTLKTAQKEVKKLRPNVDLLIAVTHQGYEADIKLAKTVSGIDIILGSHTQTFLQIPTKVASTWIFQSAYRNQFVGVIPLQTPFKPSEHQLVALDAGYEPAKPSEIQTLVLEYKLQTAELNKKADPTQCVQENKSTSSIAQTFPRCSECHEAQFRFWTKTRHFESLNRFSKISDKDGTVREECFRCHSVALSNKEPAGTKRGETKDHSKLSARELIDLVQAGSLGLIETANYPVQCENCHGKGGDHPFGGSNYGRKVETKTCLECHTQKFSPSWYKDGVPDIEKVKKEKTSIACPRSTNGEIN